MRTLTHLLGLGGDASILAAPAVLLRRHNCHVHRCPRLGRHRVAGTDFLVCRRHHPDENPTGEDVRAASEGTAP